MQRNALQHSRHQAGKFKKLKRSSILIQKQQKSYSTANLDGLISCLIYHWWSNTGKTAITSQSSTTCYYLMTESSFTPLNNGYSPAELIMCRKLRTKIPTLPTPLSPSTPSFPELERKESIQKQKQRMTYNNRHAAKEVSPLQKGKTVYIKDMKKSGTVIDNHHNPRSFIIQTDSGVIRRNRTHLVPTNENNSPADTTKTTSNNGCRSCSPLSSHSESTTAPLQQPDLQFSLPASSPPPDVPPPPVQRNKTPKRTTNPTTVGWKKSEGT